MGDASYTVFTTVVSGTFVVVAGQLATKIWLEPIQDTRRLIGRICHMLVFDAPVIATPEAFEQKARDDIATRLRNFSAELDQQMTLIPAYGLAASFRLVPYESDVRRAADYLILLSNRLGQNRGEVSLQHMFLMQDIQERLGVFRRHKSRITQEQFSKALGAETVRPWPSESKLT